MEIEHDGKKYILKSQVESIIKERVAKVAQRASEAETQLKEVQSQLDAQNSKQASYDILAEQVSELQSKLASSETKFKRYQSMSQHGITDQDLIDVIEWQFDRAMKDKPQKEQKSLDEWLSHHLENPDEAPISLRPHLKAISPSSEPAEEIAPDTDKISPESDRLGLEGLQHREYASEPPRPPRTNKGAVPAPEGKDILKRASDPNFYNENYEAIQKAWMAKYQRR